MESVSLCLALSYCFNIKGKFNSNNKYVDYLKKTVQIFISCSKKSRDYCPNEMDFHFTKWSYNIFSPDI